MHDLDRRYMETEGESFEFTAEGEGEVSLEGEVFHEGELQELAAELLSVSNEGELNHFLGGLIKKAAGAVGKLVKSPVGQHLGGMLKGLARKALPMAGKAIGNWIAPGSGGQVGQQLAQQAGSMFGLELEGLSQEDREFEVAKQFVRLAGEATKNAVSAPASAAPAQVASSAVAQAAQKFAPGLNGQGAAGRAGAASGRWVRRGNRIILLGV